MLAGALCAVLTIGAVSDCAGADVAAATAPPTVAAHPNPNVEQWHDEAIAVGWPEQAWPRLSCIIGRESHGDETAYNGRDPGYGSFGLTQLNMSKGRFGTWAAYAPILSGDITHLYDPTVNLAVALDLYHRAERAWGNGWRPWGGCR